MKKKSAGNLAVAVDLGGTNLRVAVVDRKGKILKKIEVPTRRKGKSGNVVTSQIIGLIKKVSDGLKIKDFLGIGISSVGPLDFKKGVVINTPNITFGSISIVKPIKRRFGLSVFLINDCNAGALGEKYFGAGKKEKNIVYVTISSGIGGGAIVNGKLVWGKDGNATEIGHMHVETEYNLPCTCGKGHGHWEGCASGNNIPKFFRIWAKKKNLETRFLNSAGDIFAAARKKDKIALEFMEELGRMNGRGLSNVIAAYDPKMIIFGGAVMLGNGDLVLKHAKKYIDKFLRWPKMKISPLGENAPLLGAAAMVFNEQRTMGKGKKPGAVAPTFPGEQPNSPFLFIADNSY